MDELDRFSVQLIRRCHRSALSISCQSDWPHMLVCQPTHMSSDQANVGNALYSDVSSLHNTLLVHHHYVYSILLYQYTTLTVIENFIYYK